MKMTQLLVSVLAKVLFHKEKKNYEDAQMELESAAKTIVGIDLKLISILSIEDVLQLMKTSDVYAGRCLISAELLKEYGDILGEKGKLIKKLGTDARIEIEKFLGQKVFLELFVKVKPKWRDNDLYLKEYGYY